MLLCLFSIQPCIYLVSRDQKTQKKEDIVEKPEPVEEKVQEHDTPQKVTTPKRDYEYVSTRSSRRESIYDDYESGYVKLVGYGPVLEISGNRIKDMRNNVYYRIQDNYVYQDGGGVIYEISGNKIRSAFDGYLFEISGSSINKVFGGFYASISGNYITKYDSSIKYEVSFSLNTKQLLVVAVLLFD